MESAAPFPTPARPQVQSLRASRIREVANAAMGREDVLPFWFGEPDEATPDHICEAAIRALGARQTFYVQTLGLPPLRQALARYLSALHGRAIDESAVAVTSSGTSALMLATQALLNPGDRVVAITPLWPNLVEMPKVLGADVTTVPLVFTKAGWCLDMDRLLAALQPGTRALLVNSPNNPTGWTLTRQEQQVILAHCRRHGIWIVSDDVYQRVYYGEHASAPSFLDIAEATDRLISCNSFSKAWRMTGWRLGWMVVPPDMLAEVGKLIEYSTTCAPPFVQSAGLVALEQGEPQIRSDIARLRRGRDHLWQGLAGVPGLELPPPAAGGMYAFFRADGASDSLDFCRRLVAQGGLGLAPGSAFGPEGEGYLRWCFASDTARIDEGIARLSRFMRTGASAGPHSL